MSADGTKSIGPAGLDALADRVARDLDLLEMPARRWLPAPADPTIENVVIAGAGLSGLTIAFGLWRRGVDRVRIIDAEPEGHEGPWLRSARMRTLRSPKTLSGPDLGVPSLTYRAWHEARRGADDFDRLDRIAREDWMAYLIWFRQVLGLRVANRTRLAGIGPGTPGLELFVETPLGNERIRCRKLVLATGIDGAGRPYVPPEILHGLPSSMWTHSATDAALPDLSGRRIAILGAAASAFDFANAALRRGAAHVDLICRSASLPVTEILDWSNYPGFLEHFADLDAAERMRFTARMVAFRNPPTQEMYDAACGSPHFRMTLGRRLTHAEPFGHAFRLHLDDGAAVEAEHLLLGTGYTVDLAARPELSGLHDRIELWGDRFDPAIHDDADEVAAYPYLGPAFEMQPRQKDRDGFLRDVHLFNNGAVPSLGPICNGITGLKYGVPRLVSGLTRDLFKGDLEHHFATLDGFDRQHFDPRSAP